MESPLRHPPGLFHALQSRQTSHNNRTERALCWNEFTVRSIFPDDPLTGHTGCLNRLAWNELGDILASAGDDMDIHLWPFPNLHDSQSLIIPTSHHANIFGLQFLPQSGSSKLMTGAMDHSVQLHTIDANPFSSSSPSGTSSPQSTQGRARSPRPGQRGNAVNNDGENDDDGEEDGRRGNARIVDVQTTQYNCHRGRIKEIQVHSEEPSLFWSVSEDGTVRQYDTRVPTHQQNRFESGNVLLAVQKRKKGDSVNASRQRRSSFEEQQHQNLNNVNAAAAGEPVVYRSFSRTQQEQFNATTNLAELKSLALNPLRPMQLAVAAADKYVRIYDRRRLSVGSFEAAASAAAANTATSSSSSSSSSLPAGVVTELMPPHIALGPSNLGGGVGDLLSECHPTHITFSNRGDKLLANYHGNHAFMWSTPSLFAGATKESTSKSSGDTATPANVSFGGPAAGYPSPSSSSLPPAGWNFISRPQQPPQTSPALQNRGMRRNGAGGGAEAGVGPYNLPAPAETHRVAANLALYEDEYIKALYEYNAALKIVPNSPVLLTGRAMVLLSRGWLGDKGEALRDAEDAVYYEFKNVAAQLRRAQALFECGLLESASVGLRLSRWISSHSESQSATRTDGAHSEYEDEFHILEEKIREEKIRTLQQKITQRQNREARREGRRRQGLNLNRRSPRPSGEYSHRNSSDANNAATTTGEEAPPSAAGAGASGAAQMEVEEEEQQTTPKYSSDDDEEVEEKDMVEYGFKFLERLDWAFAESLEMDFTRFYKEQTGPSSSSSSSSSPSKFSSSWLWGALPSSSSYLQRFVGHCNLQTDIKEAVFIGQDDAFVAAGSDDGRIYLYDASSGVCLRTLVGDDDIVNCIRPHPYLPVIASSGIDSTIKLWSPSSIAMAANEVETCCAINQTTLSEGVRSMRGLNERLFEILTQHPGLFGELNRRVRVDLTMGRHGEGPFMVGGVAEEDDEEEDDGEEQPPVQCRVV